MVYAREKKKQRTLCGPRHPSRVAPPPTHSGAALHQQRRRPRTAERAGRARPNGLIGVGQGGGHWEDIFIAPGSLHRAGCLQPSARPLEPARATALPRHAGAAREGRVVVRGARSVCRSKTSFVSVRGVKRSPVAVCDSLPPHCTSGWSGDSPPRSCRADRRWPAAWGHRAATIRTSLKLICFGAATAPCLRIHTRCAPRPAN